VGSKVLPDRFAYNDAQTLTASSRDGFELLSYFRRNTRSNVFVFAHFEMGIWR